jgi:F-type H+-transporting ATPase subunit delta
MSLAIADRYARALADVVSRTGRYAETLGELEDFHAAYAESADLREALETPAVSPGDKQKILRAILVRLGTSEATSNFLHILLSHYRIRLLETIIAAFRKVVQQRLGIVAVKLYHPGEISPEERQAIADRFEELTGKKVSLELHRDETLIGGLLAQIGSITYDGSVKGSLERLRARFTAGRA